MSKAATKKIEVLSSEVRIVAINSHQQCPFGETVVACDANALANGQRPESPLLGRFGETHAAELAQRRHAPSVFPFTRSTRYRYSTGKFQARG